MSAVVKAVEKVVDTVVKTVEAVIKDPLPTLATIGLSMVGIPPYVTQAAISAARGGDLEDIAKSAAIAYVAPSVAAKIAPAVGSAVGSVVTNEAAAKALTAATSQSLVAGSLTAATGGDWQQAAAGSFAGSMAASGYDNYVAPEVMAQAKSLGLSAESHANIQNALKSSVASGAGAAATGGDFATGFANAFVESGFETLSAKANEGLQDMKKSFLDDKGIQDNQPTRAGIPDDLVPEVPESNEGKLAQKRTPSIEDQRAAIEALPKDPNYGKLYGSPTAALESIDGKELFNAGVSDLETTNEPLFSNSGFNVGVTQKASPISEISIDGKTYFKRDITENGLTTTYYFDPVDNAVTATPQKFKLEGDVTTSPDGQVTISNKPVVISVDRNNLPPATPSEQSELLDEFKKEAFSGKSKLLTANTQFGQLPSGVDTAGIQSGNLSSKDLSRILSQADQSAAAAVEAKVAASVSPTPENIAAAEQAQLAAELDQKVLDDAQKQSSVEEVPVTGEVPPQSTTAPVTGEVPVQSANVSAPTIDQTNQRILYSILSGNATTGAPTPVAGQAGADASGLSGLQQAGMGDVQGAGGISDPIDGQTGKIGTLTGGTKMPGTGGTKAPGTGGVGLSLNAPSGGLQFSNFARSGYAPQQGNLVGSLIPNLLSELNNQSLMMMSPEEYALRTQAGNIFRVARGGLITLKKQR
jgi:hypothetical protein